MDTTPARSLANLLPNPLCDPLVHQLGRSAPSDEPLAELLAAVARIEAALTVNTTQAGPHQRPAPTHREEVTPVTTPITEPTTAMPASSGRLHPRQGGYLSKKCFEQAAKDNMPATYPPELKRAYSLFTLDLMNSGNLFEDHIGAVLTQVATNHPAGTIVVLVEEGRTTDGQRTPEGKRKKEEDTWAAYRDPNTRFIFNARFGSRFEELVSEYFNRPISDEDRVSEPDAIELGPVMPNGLRAMRFVDVKWHKTTSGKSAPKEFVMSPLDAPFFPGQTGETIALTGALNSDDWMQLAHYYRHAATLGLVDEEHSLWGAVIGKEEVLVWARLDMKMFMRADPNAGARRKQSPLELYDREFAFGLTVVDNAIARDVNPDVPALTTPEWKSDCKECPWKDVCLGELEAHGDGGHITLLPGITPPRAAAFYQAGIDDVGDLARLTPGQALEGVTDTTEAVHQARVTKAQRVHRAPGVEFVDLPRAAIEIDFDYEADTVDGVYMRGVRATGRRRNSNGDIRQRVEVHTFDDYSGTEDGELRVFVEFWTYVQDMVAYARRRRHSIRFYHYTHYERTQDKALAVKYAGQPGVPTLEQVEEFYASPLVIDLYEVLSTQLVWPTRSHSIKELAKWVRFSWRDETPGGDMSMVWYKAARHDPDPAVRDENIQRLREYNEDDTHAQIALKDWVSSLGEARKPGEKLPSVEALTAPLKPRPLGKAA